jgi:hypothetical protein
MKKLSGRGYIGFKPNEVNAMLDPHHLDVLDEIEIRRKDRKRIDRTRINNEKFKVQTPYKRRKSGLKFLCHKLQIDRGFEIAKKWRAEQNDNSR